MYNLPFQAVEIDQEGIAWKTLFKKSWPAYKKWFLKDGYAARPGYLSSVSALEKYMPELLPVYQRLCSLLDNNDIESRFLSMFNPPAYLSGCSQAVLGSPSPALLRNYDYSPLHFEGVFMKTNWLKPVMGMSDCNWGLLDGMNAEGLCMSLTFGGKRVTGIGFGIPIILRYCLETCSTTAEASEALSKIPVHMAYNVTMIDIHGEYKTVFLAPGAKAKIFHDPVATNHQEDISWPEYAKMTATLERKEYLQSMLKKGMGLENLSAQFLSPPLYNDNYNQGFGTLYTAIYSPSDLQTRLLWNSAQITFDLHGFTPVKTKIALHREAQRNFIS